MATREQMKEEFAYFGEAWNFFKRFYEVQEDDSFWDSVVVEAGAIIRRYDSTLCKMVVLAIVDELERRRKGIQKMPQNAT